MKTEDTPPAEEDSSQTGGSRLWRGMRALFFGDESEPTLRDQIEEAMLGDGTVSINDLIVIISGSPMWVAGTTNLMKLHRIGERR